MSKTKTKPIDQHLQSIETNKKIVLIYNKFGQLSFEYNRWFFKCS